MSAEDAGKYKVTAKNELGESNATISLNFDSKSRRTNRLETKNESMNQPMSPIRFLSGSQRRVQRAG